MDFAVMIVGAGPAGISTWMHLRKDAPRLAARSVVIEKASFPREKACGGGLCLWAAEVLDRLGVELDIPSLFVSDLEFRCGKEVERVHEENYFRVVNRADLDHAVARAAVDQGLDLREDEALVDVARSGRELIVATGKAHYRVQALVGADGALGIVRRKLGRPGKYHLAPTLQVVAPADPRYDAEFAEKKMVVDLTHIDEGLQGYVWHVPCLRSGVPSIAHGMCDFRVRPHRPRADMKKIFGRELESRNIGKGPETWSGHPIPWHSEGDVLSWPNVILVGDAAGIEPAFGGGIHLALAYGEIAARAIADAFRTGDFSFRDYPGMIGSHQVGRHISRYTRLALDMYGGGIGPVAAAREAFATARREPVTMARLFSRYFDPHKTPSQDREAKLRR